MTAYQEFLKNPNLEKDQTCFLWELEANNKIDDIIEFCNDFLDYKGYKKTGIKKDKNGIHKAMYNDNFVFGGAIQEGNKIAIRIKSI